MGNPIENYDSDGNKIEDQIVYDENGDVVEVIIPEDAYEGTINPIVSELPPSKILPIPAGSVSMFLFKEDNKFRVFCHMAANHPYFGNSVLVCILISSCLLACEDPVRPHAKINEVIFKFF